MEAQHYIARVNLSVPSFRFEKVEDSHTLSAWANKLIVICSTSAMCLNYSRLIGVNVNLWSFIHIHIHSIPFGWTLSSVLPLSIIYFFELYRSSAFCHATCLSPTGVSLLALVLVIAVFSFTKGFKCHRRRVSYYFLFSLCSQGKAPWKLTILYFQELTQWDTIHFCPQIF